MNDPDLHLHQILQFKVLILTARLSVSETFDLSVRLKIPQLDQVSFTEVLFIKKRRGTVDWCLTGFSESEEGRCFYGM